MGHKGFRRFLEDDSAAGLPAAVVPKIRDILSFPIAATEDKVRNLKAWKAHQMTGDRAGTWALHVTKNWRVTFKIDGQEIEIIDLDYEDYH